MKFCVTISRGPASNLQGDRAVLKPDHLVDSLREVLDASPRGVESWWSPVLWSADRRASLAWEAASAVVIDLNYLDAEGQRAAVPAEAVERLLAPDPLPGSLWHMTPRGARIIGVLREPCDDPKLWLRACEGLAVQIHASLQERGLAGRPGFEPSVHDSDLLLSRFLFNPSAKVHGVQRDTKVLTLRSEPIEILDLAMAAPERRLQLVQPPPPDPVAQAYEAEAQAAVDLEVALARLRAAEQRPEGERTIRPPDPPPPTDSDAPPEADADDAPPAGPEEPRSKVLPFRAPPPPPRSDRPSIHITTDEQRVNDSAVEALADDPRVFQRARKLVIPIRGVASINGVDRSSDALTISEIPQAKLREMMSNAANWLKADAASVQKRAKAAGTANESVAKKEKIEWVSAHPPVWSIQAVYSRLQWNGIRHLAGITEWPRLLSDGTLLTVPGYDAKTALYYEPSGPVDPVPDRPTDDQVGEAVRALREAVCDFPFARPSDFSVWLAGLLTPLSFSAFTGPAPLFLAEATRAGSGKSLLWFLVGTILQGRPMAGTPYTQDHDELGKKITSCALGGDRLIFFDNVSSPIPNRQPDFGGGPLDQALTSRSWRNRLLGKMENTPELPLEATFFATGNNLNFIGDIDRRVATCKLETPLDNPETRNDFTHHNLLEWAGEERHRLLAAALTILKAYAVAGFPQEPKPRYWGSFEGWSKIVKGCIEWMGLPFPAAPSSGRLETTEVEELTMLITALERFDQSGQGITAAEMLRCIEHERKDATQAGREVDETVQALIDALGGLPLPSPKSLGHKLRKVEGRVRGGRAVKAIGKDKNDSTKWGVRKPATGDLFAKDGQDQP
jgi:hypothetical protein